MISPIFPLIRIPSCLRLLIGCCLLLVSPVADAANTIYTLTSGAGNYSTAVFTPAGTPGVGDLIQYSTTSTPITLSLNVDVALGGIRTNGNTGTFTIGAGGGILTVDGTGLLSGNQPYGNAGVAFLGTTSSGGVLVVNAPVSLANTDLDVGNTTGVNTSVTINGAITATTNQNLNLRGNGSGGVTLAGPVGASGANLAIYNLGTSSAAAVLSGSLGPKVTGVYQNSATSSLTLSGANTFSGPTELNAGTLTASNSAATNVLQAFGTGTVALNAGTLNLRAQGSGGSQTIVTGDGTTGNNVTVGGNVAVDLARSTGGNSNQTLQFNDLHIGANTLTVSGANGYRLQFAGTTRVSGAALFNTTTAAVVLGGLTVDHSTATGTTTTVSWDGNSTGNFVSGLISDDTLDATKRLAITKNGAGTLTINGSISNTYTGATTANDGTLVLDFTNLTTATNLVDPASALVLGGATFTVKGKATGASQQTMGNLTLLANGGANTLNLSVVGASTQLTLGNTWTRGAGSTLNVVPTTTSTGILASGVGLTNGIIGGYVTYNTTAFATISGGLMAAAATTPASATSNDAVVNFASNSGLTHVAGDWAVNSLALNGGGLDIGGGTLTLTSGGFLYRGTSAGSDTISNGQLGANNSEVILHQMTSSRNLEVTAEVSGGTGSLTKAGIGKLILTAENDYTGVTNVGAGTLQIGNGGTAGSIAGSSQVFVHRGATLAYNATDASSVRNVTGDGTVSVNSGTLTLLQSGADLTIRTVTGASGGTLEFAGDGTGQTSLGNAAAGSLSYLNTAGMNYKFTNGTVNLLDNARGSTSNVEIAGGTLNVMNNPLSFSGVTGSTQTFTISSGTLNATASNGISGFNGAGGASQLGVINSTFIGTQTGGTISVTAPQGRFDLGSTSSGNVTTYHFSGGTISHIGPAGTLGMNLGADTAGTSTTTFNFSGGKLIENATIAGSQGAGAKQAFVWTGGTLAALGYNATNLTSTAGQAVVAGVTNVLTNAGGTLAPGDIGTAGRTTITGNYTVTSANAVLAIDVGGTSQASVFQAASGAYDNVLVSAGVATLGGSLKVSLINGYVAPNNTTQLYNILTSASGGAGLSGTFTNLQTATAGNQRVVLEDGLSSFLVAMNTTASTATTGGLTNVGARTVALGGYQAANTYNAASGSAWDQNNAASWAAFDAGATATPASQASGAIAQFADGALSGTGGNNVTLNSIRNLRGIQFASSTAGHHYTIQNVGSGSIIFDNTANAAAATLADSSADGNTNTVGVPITLRSNLAVSVTNAGTTLIVDGPISGPGFSVAKSGAGTLTLTGANTYTGPTTVTGGKLVVDGSLNGASLVTVATGATLGGSGSIGNLLVQAGGIHAPGNSPGVQTVTGNAGYASDSTFAWELEKNIALGSIQTGSADFDQVQVNGNLSITSGALFTLTLNGPGSTVDFSNGFWASSQQWLVFNVDGTGTGNFTLGSISTDSVGQSYASYGNFELQNSGGEIYLNWNATVIPEPSTGALLLSGIGLGFWFRRFRRHR